MKSKLSMGPLLFNWPIEKTRDFYFQVADESPVDTVYIGEVICFKRMPFMQQILEPITERLLAAGKTIIYSTMALIHSEKEQEFLREFVTNTPHMIEANDTACIYMLQNKPHCLGPYINIYNEAALNFYAKQKAVNATLPVELPKSTIEILTKTGHMDIEVQVFGRLPLAISARCAHARSYHLQKSNCQYICDKDLNGLDVFTLDKEPFLAVNGLQTMSYTYRNLLKELSELQKMGVSTFRLSPHDVNMIEISKLFRDVLDGKLDPETANNKLETHTPGIAFSNGYYYNLPGYEHKKLSEFV